MKKKFLLTSAVACLFVFNAIADGNADLELFMFDYSSVRNMQFDQDSNCVTFTVEGTTNNPWDAQFNPPTWIAPGRNRNEAFEISFDARYEGAGTDDQPNVGNITFIQGRQFALVNSADAVASTCAALGIEEQDAAWKIQNRVEQLVVEDFTGAAEDFAEGNLTRNVVFYPTAEWQHFSFTGHLGRHAADSVDLQWEFGRVAGTYSIRNFQFKVKGEVFAEYFMETVTDDEGFVFSNPSKTNLIGYVGNADTVIIPAGVTSIRSNAFKGCNSIASVTIPESVTSIGIYAFSGCSSLTSITIPESVTSIGNNAFSECNNLTSVNLESNANLSSVPLYFTKNGIRYHVLSKNQVEVEPNSYSGNVVIPASVTAGSTFNVMSIGTAFQHCGNLISITIPSSVTNIENNAFSGCSSLTSITIPESVTSIGNNAFSECNNLTSVNLESNANLSNVPLYFTKNGIRYHVLSKNQVEVASNSYSGNVVIPASVTAGNTFNIMSIGTAFQYCSNLTSVTIPNSVTTIEARAFLGCSSLTSVTIGNSVTNIGYYAFNGCSNLTSITIPNSVTTIVAAAFTGCSKLQSITIGESVTYIGGNAFEGCDLKNIECKGLIPPKVSDELLTDNIVNDANLYMNATLTCPKNAKLYRTLQPWCNFNFAEDSIGSHADTIYVVQTDTVYIISKTDTVFVSSVDTLYSIVNTSDTIYCIQTDTVYSVISRIDTVYSVVNKADTIINIFNKTDTVYVVSQSTSRFNIKAETSDAKMGMAIGTGKYEKNGDAEIVAIEKYGYHFTKWSDGNNDNPRYVKVSSDSTFTAEFEVNNYNVLAAANELAMGTVEGAAMYAYLSRTQLKAVPNNGYKFKEWSDGETANPRNILVYSDTAFTAVFVANEVTAIGEKIANAINIYAYGRTIVVENANDEISVYDAMGRLICRDAMHCVSTELQVNTPGIYIVKVGNEAKRIMIND